MKSAKIYCICVLLLIALAAHTAPADSITLKQGQKLIGTILAEQKAHLIIDLGVTVLKISKDDIAEYEYTNSFNDANTSRENPLEAALQTTSGEKLYSTAETKKTTIENCVEIVSKAVVKVSTPSGMGSGFFIHPDGYLITNYHVIERETKIEVTVFQKIKTGFEKKKFKKVKIEAINPFIDLALLKIEEPNQPDFKYVPLGFMADLKVGETVFAIGNPLGLERTVTDGVISTRNRAFQGIVYIQTNADINPGNSGGPLFNLAGQVVGVTNMGYVFFGGLGFAIPVNYVKHFIENRDAFAYDKDNPNTGVRYLQPQKRKNKNKIPKERLKSK